MGGANFDHLGKNTFETADRELRKCGSAAALRLYRAAPPSLDQCIRHFGARSERESDIVAASEGEKSLIDDDSSVFYLARKENLECNGTMQPSI